MQQHPGSVVVAPTSLAPTLKCTLGCPLLDSFLHGGFPCGTITELVGECGSGKTQLCLQLLVAAQLPASLGGLHASSLYFYTENYFPFRRLQQLARAFLASGRLRSNENISQKGWRHTKHQSDRLHGRQPNTSSSDCVAPGFKPWEEIHIYHGSRGPVNVELTGEENVREESNAVLAGHIPRSFNPSRDRDDGGTVTEYFKNVDACDNIFVQGIQTIEELLTALEQAHLLLSQPLSMPVRLIVVDSVAALFRSDFDNTAKDLTKRADWFFKVASKLKLYAQRFNLAVVVTNQVVDWVQSDGATTRNTFGEMQLGNSEALYTSGRRVVPALGISWAHCVNTRLFLSRSPETILQTSGSNGASTCTPVNSTLPDCEQLRRKRESSCKPDGQDLTFPKIKDSHSAVLQQLELELPDSILLNLSEGKYTLQEHVQEIKQVEKIEEYACMKFPEVAAGYIGLQGPASSTSMTGVQSSTVGFRRTLQVVFAPHLPLISCEFAVERDMIRGVCFDGEIYPLPETSKMT